MDLVMEVAQRMAPATLGKNARTRVAPTVALVPQALVSAAHVWAQPKTNNYIMTSQLTTLFIIL